MHQLLHVFNSPLHLVHQHIYFLSAVNLLAEAVQGCIGIIIVWSVGLVRKVRLTSSSEMARDGPEVACFTTIYKQNISIKF